jgi:UDP-N-acetylmuramoyl-tripeptide--D-alanyl-D-alanine ligase
VAPEIPRHLALGDLRRFVQERGVGALHPLGGTPDWAAPLGPATNDSRTVAPGALFVALSGERTDGHRFAADAYARGAAALILIRLPDATLPERADPAAVAWVVPDPLRALQELAAWWRAQFTLPVVGITGSVGKTTAKEILAAALGTLMPVLASPRSFNNEIGLPLTLLSLSGLHRVAALEMGIYDVGDIDFLARIALPTVGVVLNVAPIHLERAGSVERIAQAKSEMISALSPDGIAILNQDDPRVLAMRTLAPGASLTFGLEPGADWRGVDLRPLPEGLALTLIRGGRHFPLQTALPGAHHAHALLAGAAVMEAVGVETESIAPALAAVPAHAARQRLRSGRAGWLIIDDTYNASPLSVLAALDLLAARAATRRVAVLADMLELGAVSDESHRLVGEQAAARADLVIAVGPLARRIADAAGAQAHWFPDKESLRTHLDSLLAPDDVVLVKGSRGMAMEEVVAWLVSPEE